MEIAVVGTGSVAQKNYLPCLVSHEDVSVTCYSRTTEKAEEVARQYNIRHARSLDELFKRPLDAVLVLTREEQRLDATDALLPYEPKRIFFEKPLVARNGQAQVSQQDFWDAKKLLERVGEARTETAMVFNYRFFDSTLRAKALIHERDLGSPLNVVAFSHYACWSHVIDLILHFADPVSDLTAQEGLAMHPFGEGTAVPDIAATFRAGEKTLGTITGTASIDFAYPLYELVLSFERGRIHLRGLDEEVELLDYAGDVHEAIAPGRNVSRWDKYAKSFRTSIDAYLDAIRQDGPPPVPGVAGLLELQFEAGLRKAIAEQRPVTLPDKFPTDPLF